MATLVFRPDANPETSSVDGHVRCQNLSGEDWATLHAGISGRIAGDDSAAFSRIWITSDSVQDKWESIYRGVISFNTTSLPDDLRITSAALSLHGGAGKQDEMSIAPSINVYGVTLFSNTVLHGTEEQMNTMWDTFGTTAYCDTPIAYASWDTAGWNDFVFNAAGLAAISGATHTQLSLREVKYDVSGDSPVWYNSGTQDDSLMGWWTADWDSDLAPKLTIVYTAVPKAGNFAVVETRLHWMDTSEYERYILGVVIGASTNAPGNVAVVEERIQYVDTSGYERYWQGIEIDTNTNPVGNIAVVEERIQYIDTSSKERYILGVRIR